MEQTMNNLGDTHCNAVKKENHMDRQWGHRDTHCNSVEKRRNKRTDNKLFWKYHCYTCELKEKSGRSMNDHWQSLAEKRDSYGLRVFRFLAIANIK